MYIYIQYIYIHYIYIQYIYIQYFVLADPSGADPLSIGKSIESWTQFGQNNLFSDVLFCFLEVTKSTFTEQLMNLA
jgi:hypothetical protein